jgi:hypothetical protein
MMAILSNHDSHIDYLKLADGLWYSREEMVRRVKAGEQFYVMAEDGATAYLEVDTYFDAEYVRTIPDRTKKDNLLSLPEESRELNTLFGIKI